MIVGEVKDSDRRSEFGVEIRLHVVTMYGWGECWREDV